jgi:hypothetical protein
MTGTSRRALSFAVLAVSSGCQLVVPSDEALTGGTKPPDAGDGGDGGAPAVEGGTGGATLVQQTSATKSSTSSVTVTLPAAPRNGDALVLSVAVFASTGTPTFTVSGGGVAWSEKSKSSAHVVSTLWVGLGASSGTTSVTVTASSAQTIFIAHLSEWAGVSAFGSSQKSNGSGPPATASLGVPDGTALIYAAAASHAIDLAPPANGFVGLQTVASGDLQIEQAYRLSPPAGSYGTTWNEVSPSGNSWDAHILSFAR